MCTSHSRANNFPSRVTPVLMRNRAECRVMVRKVSSEVWVIFTARPVFQARAATSGSFFTDSLPP